MEIWESLKEGCTDENTWLWAEECPLYSLLEGHTSQTGVTWPEETPNVPSSRFTVVLLEGGDDEADGRAVPGLEGGQKEFPPLARMLWKHKLQDWRNGSVPGSNLLLEEFHGEECTWDHVKEEDRMDCRFPLKTSEFTDRTRRPELVPIDSKQLATLVILLKSQDDFTKMQALIAMKNWTANPSNSAQLESVPEMMLALSEVLDEEVSPPVRRMAAMVICLALKNSCCRQQLLHSKDRIHILGKFISIVVDQTLTLGEKTRGLIAEALVYATTKDLIFVGFLLNNFTLDSFFVSMLKSEDNFFKASILQFLKNILEHPLGFELLTAAEDFSIDLLLSALASIVPVYHNLGFQVLADLLRVSRSPYQDRIHASFIKENGIISLLALIEESYVFDPKFTIDVLTLLDYMADEKKGMNIIACVAFNMLKSMVFYDNKTKMSLKIVPKLKRMDKFLPLTINDTIKGSQDIDKYNVFNTLTYDNFRLSLIDMPDNSKDSLMGEGLRPQKSKSQLDRKVEKRIFTAPTKTLAGPKLKACEKRIHWRLNNSWFSVEAYPNFVNYAKKTVIQDFPLEQQLMDNGLKILAMEILSKLAAHERGAKIVMDLIRTLCPLLKRYYYMPAATESVGFCVTTLCQGSPAELRALLPHYHLVRELVEGLQCASGDIARYSILGALAALLKQSSTSVYNFTNFNIRQPILECLKLTPADAPALACLNNLVIINSVARFYKCRDYITSKTLVDNLFRIIQDEETEEICKIYALCSLAYLTFANKRYFSLERRKPRISDKLWQTEEERSESNLIEEELDEPEYERSGPYPTLVSFSFSGVDERLFLQRGDRNIHTPINFFTTFLINLFLQRTSIWSSFVFRYHKELMGWLAKGIQEKQIMAVDLYRTIMNTIPIIRLYYHGTISPWTKIDMDDLVLCVDNEKHQNFFELLVNNANDVTPIYYEYKLSKGERYYPTPWDEYWKRRYELETIETLLPRFYPSVFPDSIFGLGGIYKATKERVIVSYSKVIKTLNPQKTESAFIFYSKRTQRKIKLNKVSIFSKSFLNRIHLNHTLPRVNASINNAMIIILPNLYRYMRYLIHNLPFCKPTKQKERIFSDSNLIENNKTRKLECLLKLKKFYKPHVKLFSKYQLQLLLSQLKNQPIIWAEALQNNVEEPKDKLKRMILSLQHFPNSYLNQVKIPIYDVINPITPIQKHIGCPYDEAASVISTVILESYERLCRLKLPSLSRPGINISQERFWYEERRFPLYMNTPPNYWYQLMTSLGQLLVTSIDKPFNEKRSQYMVKYELRNVLKTDRKRNSTYKRRRSSASRLSLGKESEMTKLFIDKRTKSFPTPGGAKDPNSGREGNGSKKPYKSIRVHDLHLPTFTQLMIDFFFTPTCKAFQSFSCMQELLKNDSGLLKESSTSDGLEGRESYNHDRLQKELESLHDKRNISYEFNEAQKDRISFIKNNFMHISPERNYDFMTFCKFVEEGIQEVLSKHGFKCWYSEILNFLARTVCRRFEGPFEVVDDYLMNHHRQELKRLLGTSVIPFGRLRIGGQLERAILFKFLCDQLMIPCGLCREGESNAWVEVPRHPFLYPLRETCVVNLDDSPGHLVDLKSLHKASPPHDTSKEFFRNIVSGESFKENVLSDTHKPLEGFQETEESDKMLERAMNMDPVASFMKDYSFIIKEYSVEDVENIDKLLRCSVQLSEEHFTDKDQANVSSPDEVENTARESPTMELPLKSEENETTAFLIDVPEEKYEKFSWKPDPSGRFSMIIGKVADSGFDRNSLRFKYDSHDPRYYKGTQDVGRLSGPGISYVPVTTRELFAELSVPSSKSFKCYRTQELPTDDEDTETDEYFETWEKILLPATRKPEPVDDKLPW